MRGGKGSDGRGKGIERGERMRTESFPSVRPHTGCTGNGYRLPFHAEGSGGRVSRTGQEKGATVADCAKR